MDGFPSDRPSGQQFPYQDVGKLLEAAEVDTKSLPSQAQSRERGVAVSYSFATGFCNQNAARVARLATTAFDSL